MSYSGNMAANNNNNNNKFLLITYPRIGECFPAEAEK
jgi:hypothetical protein